jgi:hypothetical protein
MSTTTCYCHDPLVFGHRCKDEPSGHPYSDPQEVEDILAEMFQAVGAMTEFLTTANLAGDR